jgi:hypothetical protein
VTESTWIGLDRGDPDVAAAEHLATEIAETFGLTVSVACTHLVKAPFGHVAASLEVAGALSEAEQAALLGELAARRIAVSIDADDLQFAGPDEFISGALDSGAAHHDATSGRAFRFPGEVELRGRLSVDEILAESAVRRVEDLSGAIDQVTLVETRDHVRPQYLMGALTLLTTPRSDGCVQPFESPTPHECCGEH